MDVYGVATSGFAPDGKPLRIWRSALCGVGILVSSGVPHQVAAQHSHRWETRTATVESPPAPFSATFPSDAIGDSRSSAISSETGPGDRAWVEGLELPDFPVRLEGHVLEYLNDYRNDRRTRNTLRHWLEQEARYGPWLRTILEEQNVPEDLVAVAMIESGFDPLARSRAGAVGTWQFVEDTGKEYGLSVDRWVDERRDPAEATAAAARYFRHLHDRFGSWNLAFAAYNMGTSALLRSIQRSNSNEYWSMTEVESGLPFETTYYVAKVIACAIVIRNPTSFGFEAPEVEALTFEEIWVPGGTSLQRIANIAGIPLPTLRTLNPQFRRERLPPGDPLRVRIPPEQLEAVPNRWRSLRTEDVQTIRFRFGDSLSSIGARYSTSTRELERLNHLPRGTRPAPGEALLVPKRPSAAQATTQASRPLVPVVAVAPQPEGTVQRFFVTTGQESAVDIATAFGVSQYAMSDWNRLETTATLPAGMALQLFVPPDFDGQHVVVHRPDEMLLVPADSEAFYDLREAAEGRIRLRYRVRAGDTLGAISNRYELSVGSICRINQIAESTPLQVDQPLVLYVPREHASESQRLAFDAQVADHRRRHTPSTED